MKKFLFSFILIISFLSAEVYLFQIKNTRDIKRAVLYFQNITPFLSVNDRIDLTSDMYAYLRAYPGSIRGIEIKKNYIYFILKNNKRVLYDDYYEKSFSEKLQQPTLKDVLSDPYPLDTLSRQLPKNYDPGRYRNYEFLKSVYGRNQLEVRNNLVKVRFYTNLVYFNIKNGAAAALKELNKELITLIKGKPAYEKYIHPIEGTFNWRKIRNTSQLSGHAYGIAIDLHLKYPYYWLHEMKTNSQGKARVYTLPEDLVKLFEKHHFIWGGKWYHFDKIHFEYRPEFFYPLY